MQILFFGTVRHTHTHKKKRGPQLIEFLAYNNLHILNSIDSPPILRKSGKEGWLDLTICNSLAYNNLSNWKVIDTNNNTDHTYITYELNAVPIHTQRRRFNTDKGNHSKFRHLTKQSKNDLKEQLNKLIQQMN